MLIYSTKTTRYETPFCAIPSSIYIMSAHTVRGGAVP